MLYTVFAFDDTVVKLSTEHIRFRDKKKVQCCGEVVLSGQMIQRAYGSYQVS